MSWILKYLSPSKRGRSSIDGDSPPKKKSRSQDEDNTFREVSPLRIEDQQTFDSTCSADLGLILSSALIPRPLCLVLALDKSKNLTVAPTTYCTLVSENPAYISIGLHNDSLPEDSLTDSLTGLLASREFTVSIVTERLVDSAIKVAGSYKNFRPDSIADLARTGITTCPSSVVAVPRIAQAAVTLECRLKHRISIDHRGEEGVFAVVIAEVICIVADKRLSKTAGQSTIDPTKLQPVAVLGGDLGARVTEPYSLPLEPMESVRDPVPPIIPPTQPADSVPSPEVQGGRLGEELAMALAEAVAEELVTQPAASSVKAVEVTLKKEVSAAPSARSTRSRTQSGNREGTPVTRARTREATPVSVIVKEA